MDPDTVFHLQEIARFNTCPGPCKIDHNVLVGIKVYLSQMFFFLMFFFSIQNARGFIQFRKYSRFALMCDKCEHDTGINQSVSVLYHQKYTLYMTLQTYLGEK